MGEVIPFEERRKIIERICDLREMKARHTLEDQWILKLGRGFESKLFSKSSTKIEGRLTRSLLGLILHMDGILDVEIDPELGVQPHPVDPQFWRECITWEF